VSAFVPRLPCRLRMLAVWSVGLSSTTTPCDSTVPSVISRPWTSCVDESRSFSQHGIENSRRPGKKEVPNGRELCSRHRPRQFDRQEVMMYKHDCPAKQKRATLGSDPPRDSRMRLRRISVGGNRAVSPPRLLAEADIQSCLSCLRKPRGFGGRAPNYKPTTAYRRSGKFHFTLNQDNAI